MAILTYHHIADCPFGQEDHRGLYVPPSLFRQQLAWLKSAGYQSVNLDTIVAGLRGDKPLPTRWVCITFDDGFRNNYLEALPALQEHGYSATVFLITDRVNRRPQTGAWDDYLSHDEVQHMRNAGIQFGSHTHTHPRLTKLSSEDALVELETSRDILQNDFGIQPEWFCYPYGNFSPRIADLVKKAGYNAALSTIRDNRIKPDQLYWLPRVMVMNDTTPQRLRYMLSTTYHLVHAWKNRRRWKSIQ